MSLKPETRRGVIAGLIVCIPVFASVVATVFALERWWPTTYAGLISGAVGTIVFLVGLPIILKFR